MYSILYIIPLGALIFSAINDIACQDSDKNLDNVKTPRDTFDLGPLRFEAFYNETDLREKLRLNKSYFKLKIFDKQLPDLLYGSFKWSRIEQLMRCDNLTLESPEVQQDLECLPIEAFITDRDIPNNTGAGYVRRSSIRVRQKLPKWLPQASQEYHVYPLKKAYVEKSISNIVEAHNLTNLDFTGMKVDLGYYYETHLGLDKDDNQAICSGKVFLSINRTEILIRLANDPYPEYLDEISHFKEEGWKNGYLLSFQDVSCTRPGYSLFFSIKGSLTIIQQSKFPYLIVRHTMKASPLSAILDYTSQVTQTLAPEVGPDAYNTTVFIKSSSGFFDLMNFELNQVFANEDFENGIEHMRLINGNGAAIVNSVWNASNFLKEFKLMGLSREESDAGRSIQYMLEEMFKIFYSNDKSEDHYVMTLKVLKKLIDPWISNTLEQLIDIPQNTEEAERAQTKYEHFKDEL